MRALLIQGRIPVCRWTSSLSYPSGSHGRENSVEATRRQANRDGDAPSHGKLARMRVEARSRSFPVRDPE